MNWFRHRPLAPCDGVDLLPHLLHVCASGPAVGKKAKPCFSLLSPSASLLLLLCTAFVCSAVVLQCKKSFVSSVFVAASC